MWARLVGSCGWWACPTIICPPLGMRSGPTFGAADADPRPRRSRRRDQKQAGAAVEFRPARGSLSGGEVTRRPLAVMASAGEAIQNPRREQSRIASSLLHDSRRPRRPGPHQYPDQREWPLGKRWKLLAKSDGELARNSDIDAGSVALRTSRYASFLLVARRA